MSKWALGLAALLYLGAAIENGKQRAWAMAFVFVCYALANVGLALATQRK